MAYDRPERLDDALAMLAAGSRVILAGGTDLYTGTTRPTLDGDILDITAVKSLRGIGDTGDRWRLGAATRWSDVVAADLPPAFDGLKLAAVEVGSVQIQNAGTVGGNLCNASPAADGVPPLLALDAEVELASLGGMRRLALADFIQGVRRVDRAPDELLTAILVPKGSAAGRSSFLKLGARKYLVISIAMVSVRLVVEDHRIVQAAFAVGSCSAVARRLPDIEKALLGRPADPSLADAVTQDAVDEALSPIDDVRGSAAYRAEAATELLRRAILRALFGPERQAAA